MKKIQKTKIRKLDLQRDDGEWVTVFDADHDNNGEGLEAKQLLELIQKIDEEE